MNKKQMAGVTAAALSWLFAAGSASAADFLKPGLWEETVVKDGVTGDPKGEIDFDCVTPSEAASLVSKEDFQKAMLGKMAPGCKLRNYQLGSKELDYDIACAKGGGISARMVLESPTRRHTLVTMDLGKGPGTKETTGRWISADCGEHADEAPAEDDQ